ncbi:MAG: S-layer homology domain-containing protein [Candidatus Gracilibacteria bacterium]
MQTKKPKTRYTLYLTIVLVLLLGGLAYTLSQSGFLKGMIKDGGFDFEGIGGGGGADCTTAEACASLAQTASEDAKNAFDAYDQDALETAQNAADAAADQAETFAGRVQTSADQAQADYEAAYAAWEGYNNIYQTYVDDADAIMAEKLSDEAQLGEYRSFLNTVNYYYGVCLDGAPIDLGDEALYEIRDYISQDEVYRCTYDTVNYCDYTGETEIPYDCAFSELNYYISMYEDQVENSGTRWAAAAELAEAYYRDNVILAENARDAAEAAANAAQVTADTAATYATKARSYADLAASYSFLACSSLTLSPSSYEMAADETEATFDLTATVTIWDSMGTDVTTTSSTQTWRGTLILETDSGNGQFTYGSTTNNPLEIDLTAPGDVSVSFAGGIAGDIIKAKIVEEEEITCHSNFTITQTAAATPTGVTITESANATTATEGGVTDSYTVVLDAQPTANVTVAVTPDTQVTASPSTLTFTSTNWSTAQTVTVTPVDDTAVEGTHSGVVKHTATSSDADYDGISIASVTASITDNDVADVTDDTVADTTDDTVADTTDDTVADTTDNDVATDTTDDTADNEVPTLTRDIILSTDYTCADSFVDTKSEWHEDIICRAKQAGWVKGYSDYVFGPDGNITRAEFVKVLTKIFGMDESDASGMSTDFLDVSADDWYSPYVMLAEDADVIRTRDSGYYFNPNEPVTRAWAILWAMRAADQSTYSYDVTFSDVENEDFFAYALAIASSTYVDTAESTDQPIVEGYADGTFRPDNNIARSEAMAIATRVAIAWGVASEDWGQ